NRWCYFSTYFSNTKLGFCIFIHYYITISILLIYNMNYKNILQELEDGILVLTINRPSKLNALNKETIEELNKAFVAADKNNEVKVIIVTGSGDKAFVAGADISEFADFSPKEGKHLAAHGQKILFDTVANLDTPVIAAINGFALGGGLELA